MLALTVCIMYAATDLHNMKFSKKINKTTTGIVAQLTVVFVCQDCHA